MANAHWVARHWLGVDAEAGSPPDTPGIAAVDNGDGTATVTISGSSAGAFNAASTMQISNDFSTSSWTDQASRTGDGTIDMTLAAGYYWVRVVSSLGGQSAVGNSVYLRVTDGTPALLQQILEAVQSRIRGLALAGISSENVIVRDVPTDRNIQTKPCVVIAPYRAEQMPPSAGTNASDEVGYPIVVAIVDHKTGTRSGESAYEPDSSARFKWRQDIVRAFRHQRLANVADVYGIRIEPLDIVDAGAWFQRNVHFSGLILRAFTREPRGID